MEDEKKIFSTEETKKDTEEAKPHDTLDDLILSADDEAIEDDYQDMHFEEFMAEYRDLISKSLSESANLRKKVIPEEDPDDEEDDESEFLISLPKKQKENKTKKSTNASTDWDEEITLAPEEYAELDDDIMHSDMTCEEEFEPDFDLGETVEDSQDKFQLSINFEGEKTEEPDAEEARENKYNPEKPRKIDWVFDIAEMFVFILVAVMLLTTFLFKHSVVVGDSMNKTLEEGDHLIISDFLYKPERGQIIVFEDYSTSLEGAIVKRIVGLPGETVEVKVDEEGIVRVYIKGVMLPEEYAYNAKDCNPQICGPITLGENEVFVMGDNRYHSMDSRYSEVGPIDIDSILGKVLFRFFPLDKFGTVDFGTIDYGTVD